MDKGGRGGVQSFTGITVTIGPQFRPNSRGRARYPQPLRVLCFTLLQQSQGSVVLSFILSEHQAAQSYTNFLLVFDFWSLVVVLSFLLLFLLSLLCVCGGEGGGVQSGLLKGNPSLYSATRPGELDWKQKGELKGNQSPTFQVLACQPSRIKFYISLFRRLT